MENAEEYRRKAEKGNFKENRLGGNTAFCAAKVKFFGEIAVWNKQNCW